MFVNKRGTRRRSKNGEIAKKFYRSAELKSKSFASFANFCLKSLFAVNYRLGEPCYLLFVIRFAWREITALITPKT